MTDAENEKSEETQNNLAFPVARIRRIIKLDPDVKIVGREAVSAIAKATELFVEYLATCAVTVLNRKRTKTMRESDFSQVVHMFDPLEFLRQDFPRVFDKKVKAATSTIGSSKINKSLVESGRQTNLLFNYFGQDKLKSSGNGNAVKLEEAEEEGEESDNLDVVETTSISEELLQS